MSPLHRGCEALLAVLITLDIIWNWSSLGLSSKSPNLTEQVLRIRICLIFIAEAALFLIAGHAAMFSLQRPF